MHGAAETKAPARRARQSRIDGVLLIDKPVGPSSQQVVGHLKRLFNAEKVGHGGTLDPLASGLLVVGFGEATKFLQRHLTGDKCYVASLTFGARTTTGDAEGEVVEKSENVPSAQLLNDVLPHFLGEISQQPPIFSALKVNGKPAYARARAGETVELAPRNVRIERIALLHFSDGVAQIEVACGPGTYIRTLGEDIARACGSVGHLSALRRTGARDFRIEDAATIETLAAQDAMDRLEMLKPPDALLADVPIIALSDEQCAHLNCGRTVAAAQDDANLIARAYHHERFCGLVRSDRGTLYVERWLASSASH